MSPARKIKSTSSLRVKPGVGSIIDNGTLELVEVLGVGGYGTVYRAVDIHTQEPYAVKCLSRPASRHLREISLHSQASGHPHVVTIHRVVEEAGWTYMVMDCADDADLFTQILQSCTYLGNDAAIKHIFLQIVDAVEHCHSLGIFHRDLKPENILCFDGGYRIAIADFGLATTEKSSHDFRTGSVFHMSPECQNGETESDAYCPRAHDVWSLAIVLINLCTGRNPWKIASATDSTFRAFISKPDSFLPSVLPISREMNVILTEMLEVDWTRRPSLKDVRSAIQSIDTFYIKDAIFHESMARCPWEFAPEDLPVAIVKSQAALLESVWSTESAELVMINLGQSSDLWTARTPPTLFSRALSDLSSYGSSEMILTPSNVPIQSPIEDSPYATWQQAKDFRPAAEESDSEESCISALHSSVNGSLSGLDLDFAALSDPMSSPSAPPSPILLTSPVIPSLYTPSDAIPVNTIIAPMSSRLFPILRFRSPAPDFSPADDMGTTRMAARALSSGEAGNKTPLRRRMAWFSPNRLVPSLISVIH